MRCMRFIDKGEDESETCFTEVFIFKFDINLYRHTSWLLYHAGFVQTQLYDSFVLTRFGFFGQQGVHFSQNEKAVILKFLLILF